MRLASLMPLMIVLIAILLPALVWGQGTPPKPSNDDRIYDEVRRKLADDADVRGAGLAVTVKDGAVTLEGRVRDEKARQKAPKIAKKIKGVRAVENKLKLFSES